MRYEFSSSQVVMAAHGKISNALTPWHIIINTNDETVTVTKRNKYLIGVYEDTIDFRNIRRVSIDEHLLGADITISTSGGSLTAYYLDKSDCKRIKRILMDYKKE